MISLRELNHRKNHFLRRQKEKLFGKLLSYQNTNQFSPDKTKNLRHIVLLRNDNKLGDMIAATVFFREVKKQLPHVKISVIAGPDSALVLQHNPHVDQVLVCPKKLTATWHVARQLRRESVDLYIDLDRRTSVYSSLFLYLIRPVYAFGFNRQNEKMFNITQSFHYDEHHVTQWYQTVLALLGLACTSVNYDLFLQEQNTQRAAQFVRSLPARPTVTLNLFSSSRSRSFTWEQATQLAAAYPNYNFVLLGRAKHLRAIFQNPTPNLFLPPSDFQLPDLFALLSVCAVLLTPDTVYVHAAAALNCPQIILYNDTPEVHSWAPLSTCAKIFLTKNEFSKFDILTLGKEIPLLIHLRTAQ